MHGRHYDESIPLRKLRHEVDRLFRDFFSSMPTRSDWGLHLLRPPQPVNLWEDDGSVNLETELPGMREDEIDITISGNELHLKGQRSADTMPEGAMPLIRERERHPISRVVHLPVEVDSEKIEATFKNGVLTVQMPKTSAAQTRQIPVRTTAGAP